MLISTRAEEPKNPHISVRGGVLEIREHEGDSFPLLTLLLDRGEVGQLCRAFNDAVRRWGEHEAQRAIEAADKKAAARTELPTKHESWCVEHNYEIVPAFCASAPVDFGDDRQDYAYMAQHPFTGEPEISLGIGPTMHTLTPKEAEKLATAIDKHGSEISATLHRFAAAAAVTA